MNYLKSSVLIIMLLTFDYAAQGQDSSTSLERLDWMLGTWERTNVRPGTTAFEKWEKQSDVLFTGKGWSMKGQDTTFVEKLRIEVKEGNIYYVADVKQNTTPTYFKVVKMEDNGFVSENPDHDFPKMISYQLKDAVVTAIISGGGDKKMGFVFKKLED